MNNLIIALVCSAAACVAGYAYFAAFYAVLFNPLIELLKP